jgi:hypothetical protein
MQTTDKVGSTPQASLEANENRAHAETAPLWRRLRAEVARWEALAVLKSPSCPGLTV